MILITCESAMSVKTRHILPGTFQPSTEDLFTVIVSVLCESLGCDLGLYYVVNSSFFFVVSQQRNCEIRSRLITGLTAADNCSAGAIHF